MTIFYSPDTVDGTSGSDFILSTPQYPNSTLRGGAGNDVIFGDYSYFEIIRQAEARNTQATALNLEDNTLLWINSPTDIYSAPNGDPYGTVYIEGQAGATRWVSFTAAAGALISFDVDFGFGSGFGSDSNIVVDLVDANGSVLLTVDDVTSLDPGSYSLYDPRYEGFIAPHSGTYYLHFREADGNFEGDEAFMAFIAVSGHTHPGTLPAGDDLLDGQDGNDELHGGGGNDRLFGGNGNDLLMGGTGWDVLDGGAGNDNLQGGAGRDVLFGQGYTQGPNVAGSDSFDGGSEDDLIFAGRNADTIFGGTGNDIIYGDTTYVAYDARSTSLTPNLAYVLSDPSIWSTEYSPIVGNSTTVAHTTAYVETYPGEYRTFSIDLIAGQTITLDIDASYQASTNSTVDTELGLYFNNAYVKINDDSSSIDPGSTTTRESYLTYVVPTSGTYYIVAYEFGTDPYFEGDESFLLNVSVTGHAATAIVSGGADTISGGDGDDIIYGGVGNDIIVGGSGLDTLAGGDDSDSIYTQDQSLGFSAPSFGNAGIAPTLDTADERDTVDGGNGNDTIYAGSSDIIDGGAGFDTLYFSSPSRAINADFTQASQATANAQITGIEHVAWIDGSVFADTIKLDNAFGTFASAFGNGGDDQLTAGLWTVSLSGGDGNDTLDGRLSQHLTLLDGGNNDDRLIIGTNNVGTSIDGGSGSDTLVVASVASSLGQLGGLEAIEFQNGVALTLTETQFNGGFAATSTLSGSGSLTINMGAGDSELYLQQLLGGSGVTITVNGSANNDVIKGAVNAVNIINGGDGADSIRGGTQADTLNGGNGNDKIEGGIGADILTGGAGADTFRYQSASASTVAAPDRITDFVSGTDKLGFLLLDSNPATPGIQGFSYIDTQAFHATGAAEIRYGNSGSDLIVQLDLNGDGAADMAILLQGLAGQSLSSGDFVLAGVGSGAVQSNGINTVGDVMSHSDRLDLPAIGFGRLQNVQAATYDGGGNAAIDLANGVTVASGQFQLGDMTLGRQSTHAPLAIDNANVQGWVVAQETTNALTHVQPHFLDYTGPSALPAFEYIL